MALVLLNLGYGKAGIYEVDKFTRILDAQVYDSEEIRIERPDSYGNGFEYVAIAPVGSDTGISVWACVRCTWVNKQKVRMQFRDNVSWDSRAVGW
jgi:hypothetical protein